MRNKNLIVLGSVLILALILFGVSMLTNNLGAPAPGPSAPSLTADAKTPVPVATATPTSTVASTVTVSPTVTLAPAATVAPAATASPAVTLAPTTAAAPAVTLAPTAKPTPAVTATPAATADPTVTTAPTATAAGSNPSAELAKAYLVVTVNNMMYQPIPLTEEASFTLTQKDIGAVNVVHVTADSVFMESSTCEGHDCVKQGTVSLENRNQRVLGNMIICLPNKVSLELYTPEEVQALLTNEADTP